MYTLLVVQSWFKNEDDDLGKSKIKIVEGLNPVEVPVSAKLGETNLSVDDFLRLSIGDIIKLDNLSSKPIKVMVQDREYYYAKPGTIGKKMGVTVLDIIDKDVKNNE